MQGSEALKEYIKHLMPKVDKQAADLLTCKEGKQFVKYSFCAAPESTDGVKKITTAMGKAKAKAKGKAVPKKAAVAKSVPVKEDAEAMAEASKFFE